MPNMRFAPPVLALALLVVPHARAQDVDADIAAAADRLKPADRRHLKVHNGNPLVAGQVTLTAPIADAGRIIDRVDVMQEWDCKTGRYRITRKTLRTSDGQYVRSDPRDGPWTPVADAAPGAESLKRLCPGRAANASASAGPAIPPGAQVVTFPPR
jgi:hypothetical protein